MAGWGWGHFKPSQVALVGPVQGVIPTRYRDRSGMRVPAEETFATRGGAAAWLARAQSDQDRGVFVDPRAGRITLAAFAERFLADRVLADWTRETYRGLLDGHVLPTLGGLDLGQLAPGTVRGWYARLARAHPSTAPRPTGSCAP